MDQDGLDRGSCILYILVTRLDLTDLESFLLIKAWLKPTLTGILPLFPNVCYYHRTASCLDVN